MGGEENKYMINKILLIFFAAGLLLALATLSGCRSVRYVTVPEYHTRDSVTVKYSRDSVFLRDSVYVDRWTANDTVYVTRTSLKYIYKDRWSTDTAYISRTDSVRVPYPVEKKVYKLRWWQKSLIWAGVTALIVVAFTIWWLVRAKRK